MKTAKTTPAKTEQPATLALAKLDKLPVAGITGTWDGARKWRDGAKMMEQGKLFCQVMLGLELITLRAALPNESGKRSDLTSSQLGTRWEELLDKELELSRSSAYRMMEMAEEAKKRLKKLPELKDFDPTTTAFAELPEKQAEALTSAVKKLTDGSTQTEFMREMGLAKNPGAGAGRKAGDGGNAPKSIGTQADIAKALAADDWRHLDGLLLTYRAKFTLLDDMAVTAQVAALEQALNARKQWLNTAAEKRDAKAADEAFA